jgi:AcrR family transcriptional regulator
MEVKSKSNIKQRTRDRQKIISYSQHKFFSEGFSRTTMDEISRELCISKNTLYKYFPNKDKLILEVFKSFIRETSVEVEKIVSSDENAVQKFVNLIHTVTNKLIRLNDKLFKDLQLHAPHIWIKIDEVRRQLMMKKLGKLIEQGKREELFINYPAEIIQTIFISSLRSVMNPEFLMNSKYSKQESIKYTFRILLNGSLTKKGLEVFKKLKLPK